MMLMMITTLLLCHDSLHLTLARTLQVGVIHGVAALGPGGGEHLAGRVVDGGAPFACPRGW